MYYIYLYILQFISITFTLLLLLFVLIIVGQAALEIQSNGVTSSQTQFCTGDELVFTCTFTASLNEWVVLPFLDGTPGNGRIPLDTTETVGNITLSASGTGDGRRSALQVTAFPGLNEVNILCREAEGDPNVNQNATIRVIGKNNLIGIS